MNSRTYRMSAESNEKALAADPANDLFWRFNIRRLTAEEIRDSILAVNGSINLKLGGPSVYPPMPEAVLQTSSRPDEVWKKDTPVDQHTRRTIYTHVKRSLLDPLLQDFDLADTDSTCPVRFVTTQPTQALAMLNSEFVGENALVLADRLRREIDGENMRERMIRAFELVTSRSPTEQEVELGMKFIQELKDEDGLSDEKAFDRFCLLAFNLNEFMFLD